MSAPRPPLKQRLRMPDDEQALARIWSRIDAGERESELPLVRRVLRLDRPALAGAVLAVAAAVVVWVGISKDDTGPLRLADGQPIAAVQAPASGTVVAMSDGSRVTLAGGARFEPLLSTATSFVAMLQTGRADFDVHPGGPRRWQIECGLATVEVVGTGFSCTREPGRLRVAVQHGVVLVRGDQVRERAQRLTAGQSLEIVDPLLAPAAGPGPARRPEPTAAPEPTADAAPPAVTPPLARVSWRELAQSGRQRDAFAALGTRGLARETRQVGVADLLLLADVARLSGHPRDAVAPLQRVLDAYPRDAQAPLAAFALGRLELDELDAPAQAARALDRALSLGLPQTLREDARARLVEAHARAGNAAAARDAAAAYNREFPDGRYRARIESQLP
ncbi:MAG TPA: FecR domain-containing protein [Polyangia bacterium]|nr:FecR domain-containing protein [Polyangia bacterium]